MASAHRSPSAGSFARWAVVLVLPLILSAAAIPWALERLRAGRLAAGRVAAARQAAEQGGARLDPEAAAGAATPPSAAREPDASRPPETPSVSEIEAARAAEVEAGRLQQRGLAGAASYSPRGAVITPDGERVAPFHGFGLSVESRPPGARVHAAGRDVGETPIVTTVDCRPGRDVEVQVALKGYRTARRAVRCRADALLELRFALVR